MKIEFIGKNAYFIYCLTSDGPVIIKTPEFLCPEVNLDMPRQILADWLEDVIRSSLVIIDMPRGTTVGDFLTAVRESAKKPVILPKYSTDQKEQPTMKMKLYRIVNCLFDTFDNATAVETSVDGGKTWKKEGWTHQLPPYFCRDLANSGFTQMVMRLDESGTLYQSNTEAAAVSVNGEAVYVGEGLYCPYVWREAREED